jgi:hypothetical protein
MARGFHTPPEIHAVRLDPSIRTAGQVVAESAKHADEYPDLVSVPDSPESRSASVPWDDSGDETMRTEKAS